ncbi:MAG: CPBP family intramembrane glutamic endopeptidase [Ferruginibacter sp.]
MVHQTALYKILYSFLTRIIIGILVVGGSVVLVEIAGRYLINKTQITEELENAIVGISDAGIALFSYVLLFRFYEKRQIKELSWTTFGKNALIGFFAGLALQSLVILVIYLAGGYSIIHSNPVSFLLPAFVASLTAGFVVELLIRGIIFRLTEEKFGTLIALIISALLFALSHAANKETSFLSVLSTTIQAGILLSAVYVFSRNLWISIFLHFAWDFAEPGIYGGINPGINIEKSLLTSKITGSELLTGGQFGPGNSIQALMFCLIAGLLLLWLAKQRGKFIKPYYKK